MIKSISPSSQWSDMEINSVTFPTKYQSDIKIIKLKCDRLELKVSVI